VAWCASSRSLNPRRGIAPDAALVHREVQEQPTELQSFQPLGPAALVHHGSAHIHLGMEVRDRGVLDRAVGQPRGVHCPVAADAGRVWDESTAGRTVSSDGFRACVTPPS
jgi:hypothetical protein